MSGAGSGLPNIEKLQGSSNFDSWKFDIECILIHDDLWKYVENPLTTDDDVAKRGDQKARTKICLLIENQCKVHVRKATTAHETWRNLKTAFEDKGINNRCRLLSRLVSLKLNMFNSITEYVTELMRVANQLSDLGKEIDDELLAVCNMQEYIYPGLKLLRKISIPFISLFPALTDFYHETCLIENPFFTVVDMDCWPCSTVSNIMVITDPKPVTQQHTAPFMYETDQQVINLQSLRSLYVRNKDVFDKDSSQVLGNNKFYVNPSDMFNNLLTDDSNFYVWKFNNMNAAKVLRQVIPRPKVVPKFGQSTERFIIIDKSQKLFHIPETECSFSFLLSLSGSRTIDLVPAEECKHRCKTLRIELKDNYLLWYNWWYWRPRIQPSSGNATFIAHVGSYC